MAELSMQVASLPTGNGSVNDPSIIKAQVVIGDSAPTLVSLNSFIRSFDRLKPRQYRRDVEKRSLSTPEAIAKKQSVKPRVSLLKRRTIAVPGDLKHPSISPEAISNEPPRCTNDDVTSSPTLKDPRSNNNNSQIQPQNQEHVNSSLPSQETSIANSDQVVIQELSNTSPQIEDVDHSQEGGNSLAADHPSNIVDGSLSQTLESLSEPHSNFIIHGRLGSVPDFIEVGENFYEATRLRPPESLRLRWTESWRTILNDRLKRLNLPQNAISTFKLCMASPTPRRVHMKPTILLICSRSCSESKRKEIERELAHLIDYIPADLTLKVVLGRVRLCSSVCYGLPSQPGSRTGLVVDIFSGQSPFSLTAGCLSRVLSIDSNGDTTQYPWSTIGAVISVGETLYALTIAHSVFAKENSIWDPAVQIEDFEIKHKFMFSGQVGSYEWSGQESSASSETLFQGSETWGLDWLLIDVENGLAGLSALDALENLVGRISGHITTNELSDGEILVIAGVTGIQRGILDSTPASIICGQSTFDVRSLALERPLADGDSGALVVKGGKVCGCIFARVDGTPWAYMLPMEPILTEIARVYSKDRGMPVTVEIPDAAKIADLVFRQKRKNKATATEVQLEPSNAQPTQSSPMVQLRPLSNVIEKTFSTGPAVGTESSEARSIANGFFRAEQLPPSRVPPPIPTRIPSSNLAPVDIGISPAPHPLDLEPGFTAFSTNMVPAVHTVHDNNDPIPATRNWWTRLRRATWEWSSFRNAMSRVCYFSMSVLIIIIFFGGIGALIWYIATKDIPVYAKVLSTVLGIGTLILIPVCSIWIFWRRRRRASRPEITPPGNQMVVYTRGLANGTVETLSFPQDFARRNSGMIPSYGNRGQRAINDQYLNDIDDWRIENLGSDVG